MAISASASDQNQPLPNMSEVESEASSLHPTDRGGGNVSRRFPQVPLETDASSPSVEGVGGGLGILPFEVLQTVLTFVPDDELEECGQVCGTWKDATAEQSFWKQKCLRGGQYREKFMLPYVPKDWKEFYFKSPFVRNLLRNCSGQDGMTSWTVLRSGGAEWKVETDHAGSGTMPDELLQISGGKQFNFATSYGWCEKEQVIDLLAEGFSEEMLDRLQPTIFISEWYAARFDCGNIFEFGVQLLKGKPGSDDDDTVIDSFSFGPLRTEQWADKNWKQATHTFRDYGPGLRFIRFWDQSKDTQFWAGHYGGKMAGAEVRFRIGHSNEES